jgi:hypothetical protein
LFTAHLDGIVDRLEEAASVEVDHDRLIVNGHR